MFSIEDLFFLRKAITSRTAPIAEDVAELQEDVATLEEQIALIPDGLNYKGAVPYYNDLPASDNTIGDTYTVLYTGSSGTEPDGTRYAWGDVEGTEQWIVVGPQMIAITESEVDTAWEDE